MFIRLGRPHGEYDGLPNARESAHIHVNGYKAQDLGLHRSPEGWRRFEVDLLTPAERRERRSVWWAIYIADKYVYIFLIPWPACLSVLITFDRHISCSLGMQLVVKLSAVKSSNIPIHKAVLWEYARASLI